MPNPNITELVSYIDSVIAATQNKSIEWKRVNPTTIVWEKTAMPQARATLQRVDRHIVRTDAKVSGPPTSYKVSTYVLEVQDLSGRRPSIVLNGGEDESINRKLEELYSKTEASIRSADLSFLKSILPQ